jgi:hypothetical protein
MNQEELQKVCKGLAEHFDTVQIVVTEHADGETHYTTAGVGNWYARKASLEEWLLRETAATNAQMFHKLNPDNLE